MSISSESTTASHYSCNEALPLAHFGRAWHRPRAGDRVMSRLLVAACAPVGWRPAGCSAKNEKAAMKLEPRWNERRPQLIMPMMTLEAAHCRQCRDCCRCEGTACHSESLSLPRVRTDGGFNLSLRVTARPLSLSGRGVADTGCHEAVPVEFDEDDDRLGGGVTV